MTIHLSGFKTGIVRVSAFLFAVFIINQTINAQDIKEDF